MATIRLFLVTVTHFPASHNARTVDILHIKPAGRLNCADLGSILDVDLSPSQSDLYSSNAGSAMPLAQSAVDLSRHRIL